MVDADNAGVNDRENPMQKSTTSELLWLGRTPPRHGPKPVLTVDRITQAAVAIADEHGLDAVSMQAVADAVGFTKMSLYRHVQGKDELIAVMIEYAVGVPPPTTADPWRNQIDAWADRLAERWGRHSWLPPAAVGRRAMGPREVAWSEYVLQALVGLRLTPAERMDVAFLLFGHMRNTQSLETAGTQAWHEPDHRRLVAERPEEFPAMNEVLADPGSADSGRAFGLGLILDGVEGLHDTRTDEPDARA